MAALVMDWASVEAWLVVEILLVAPPQGSARRVARRLGIASPNLERSEFAASLRFPRLAVHFQEQFFRPLAKLAHAAIGSLTLEATAPSASADDLAVCGGALGLFFAPVFGDADFLSWERRLGCAQSLIEQEAIPEWVALRLLGEGACVAAARDELLPAPPPSAQLAGFAADCARALRADAERSILGETLGLDARACERNARRL
jgi:hypothetical protein